MRTQVQRELCENGSDEMAPVLFVYVPKVEVELSHRGLTFTGRECMALGETGEFLGKV